MTDATASIYGKKGTVSVSIETILPKNVVKVVAGGKKGEVVAQIDYAFTRDIVVSALFREPHPRRLELLFTGEEVLYITNQSGAPFNPKTDITVLMNGRPMIITGHIWNQEGSRYALFFQEDLLEGKELIQVIHHLPQSPFLVNGSIPIGGFALLAKVTEQADHSLDIPPDLPGFQLASEMEWIYSQLYPSIEGPPELPPL